MSASPRLTAFGRFVDPSTERAYRASQLADKRALGRLLILSILALDAAFVPIDLYNFGWNREGAVAVGLRLLIVLWSAGCWWRLGAAGTPERVERLFAVWALSVAAANLAALGVLPGNHLGAAAAFAVGVVLCYLMPMRLEWCGTLGVAVAGLFLTVLVATQRPEAAGHLLIDTAVGFVMANGVGVVVGRRLQADRRRRYAAGVALAETAAELKTLRGLLPICSFCKQIRDGDGAWHRLEAYIQARTDARFTHGICPDCMANEYGMTVDSVTDTPTVDRT